MELIEDIDDNDFIECPFIVFCINYYDCKKCNENTINDNKEINSD